VAEHTIKAPTQEGETTYSEDGKVNLKLSGGKYILTAEKGSLMYDSIYLRGPSNPLPTMKVYGHGATDCSQTDYVYKPVERSEDD